MIKNMGIKVPAETASIEIRILYNVQSGRVAVMAPFNQKPTCYQILKEAAKVIKQYKKPVIAAASVPLVIQ